MSDNNLVYILDGKIYINLTNMCTNDCIFCLRQQKDDVVGTHMWLKSEKITADDVIEQLKPHTEKFPKGITFCGYGEPTMKFNVLKEVAAYIRQNYPDTYIKVNTNGHGNIINKRDILPELKGLINEFSISLNAQNKELYNTLSKPGVTDGYDQMLSFAKEAVELGFKTTMSVVSKYKDYDVDLEECENIAKSIGANFRNREYIPNGY
ncbi:MAG: TatD family nuclease-associated radical SAM protein [Cyanobacteria bacterium RUI128]|nr:TatD family nuclease-associated radical SAM protein [Cyanobacteria bacterium RUI128]